MKGCWMILLLRTRQVSLKAPWTDLDTARAPFLKHQEDPFPSDDRYFTFHTIASTSVYLLRMTKEEPLFQLHCFKKCRYKGLHVSFSNHKVAF